MPKYKEVTRETRSILCKKCGYDDLMKNGIENGVQFYRCKRCDSRFNGKDTFPIYRYDKESILKTFTTFYGGMSLGSIQNAFEELGVGHIAKSTLWEWLIEFTNQVIPYSKSFKPNVGDFWFADETVIKMHGKNKWLWALIDEDTRFLLACNLTPSRTTENAKTLFYEAHRVAGKKPKMVTTDKLQAYSGAFTKVFWMNEIVKRPIHATSGGFVSSTNTNLIERWHEYVKVRTETMRHFKNVNSAFTILQGIIINYNFLWEHSFLGNITPAQASGIDVKGMGIDNWLSLIEQARGEYLDG